MMPAATGDGRPTTFARIVLTALLFALVGPLVAGPVVIPIIWYYSFAEMSFGQALVSGVVVTLLGFWAIIPAGAVPGLAVGTTIGWLESTGGATGVWVPIAAGIVSGAIWGAVIQHNVSEFEAVAPAVAIGVVVASVTCWQIMRWLRTIRDRRVS